MSEKTDTPEQVTVEPQEDEQTPKATEAPAGAENGSQTDTGHEDDATASPDAEETGTNREAAKYRRRLREAETARDELAERVRADREAVIEKFASTPHTIEVATPAGPRPKEYALHSADDFQRFTGKSVEDYVDDDGSLSEEKMLAELTALAESRPYLIKDVTPLAGPYVPDQGTAWEMPSPQRGFSAAFKPGE